MMRSSGIEQAQRINAAMGLLREHRSRTKAVKAMVRQYGLSRRQAYRYLREAERRQKPAPIPEQKILFAVKLPESLAARIRGLARSSGKTLSAIVAEALEAFLRKRSGNG